MRYDSLGVEFHYCGDCVIWIWPWKRKGKPKYLSILASGTGEWGDARFESLRDIRNFWHDFQKACEKI